MNKPYSITSSLIESKIRNKANIISNSILFFIITFLLIIVNQGLKAQDSEGYYLSSTTNQTKNLQLKDTIPPTVITKNIDLKLNHAGKTILKPEDLNDGSYDNFGIDNMQLSKSVFRCSNLGKNIVTLIVTDVNGNTNSATAIINLIDEESVPLKRINDTTIFINQALEIKGPVGSKYLWTTGDTTKNLYLPKNYLDLGYNIIGLKIKSKSGCKNNLSFMVNVKASPFSKKNNQEIKLYPNPTSGEITIERYNSSLMQIEIYCCDGKLYNKIETSDKKTLIDINSANKGVYYFKITTTEMTKTFKVVKR